VSCWALVPLKERTACKMRLAPVLSPHARLRLVRGMLDHVILTLQDTAGIDHIALVSPERDTVSEDIELIAQTRHGLNEDLANAASEAARLGATRLVIVPADLPLLRSEDVSTLLEAFRDSGAVIAPDRHERGTNALALLAAAIPGLKLEFGENSFQRHRASIRRTSVEPAVVRRTGFAFDVDDIGDLELLRTLAPESHLSLLGADARPLSAGH
jgi:2-phospho-L-lactate/phosphoenolpyruvate guanylyltransferase